MSTKKTEPLQPDERFKRIWDVVAGIPRGCVLNYGKVAELAGMAGRARLVGRALARAPKNLDLPWQRVVNARGEISFGADTAKGKKQRKLLEAEGVEFVDGHGRIDLEKFSPERALDRMLWGPGPPES